MSPELLGQLRTHWATADEDIKESVVEEEEGSGVDF